MRDPLDILFDCCDAALTALLLDEQTPSAFVEAMRAQTAITGVEGAVRSIGLGRQLSHDTLSSLHRWEFAWHEIAVELAPGEDADEALSRLARMGLLPSRSVYASEKAGLHLARWGFVIVRVPPLVGAFAPLVADRAVRRLCHAGGTVRLPNPVDFRARDVAALAAPVRSVYPPGRPLPRGFSRATAGQGTRVGVIDSGIDDSHPALAGAVIARHDFSGEGSGDHNGHGTHVAGIIAGRFVRPGAPWGVAPGARLIDAKVFGASGAGSTLDIAAAMRWAVDQGANVLNLSLGGPGRTDGKSLLSRLAGAIARDGVMVVVSAGNDGEAGAGTVTAPGDAPEALTVGAVDSYGALAPFSSRGPTELGGKPDIVAPGVEVLSARARGCTRGNGEWVALSGTSMAAPHVAGAAAAVLGWGGPRLQAAKVRDLLLEHAAPGPGGPNDSGRGFLDVTAALVHARPATSQPATVPLGWRTARWSMTAAAGVSLFALVAAAQGWTPAPAVQLLVSAFPVVSAATVVIGDTTMDRWSVEREGCWAYSRDTHQRQLRRKVIGGDSLTKLADWYLTTPDAIANENGLSADSKLRRDDWLSISLHDVRIYLHEVQPGETLLSLARSSAGSPSKWKVRGWNCLPDDTIRAGDTLMLLQPG